MQTNNQTKSKNKIFIIWGLFIIGVILVLLIILLLALKPQTNVDTQNKQTLQPNVDAKQEQETYNRLMNKIEDEVNKLTQQEEQTSTLKYPPTIHSHTDGKIDYIKEYEQQTGNLIRKTYYKPDGKTKDYTYEYDPQTNLQTNYAVIKKTKYNNDGKTIEETFYNPDGTIKETKTY